MQDHSTGPSIHLSCSRNILRIIESVEALNSCIIVYWFIELNVYFSHLLDTALSHERFRWISGTDTITHDACYYLLWIMETKMYYVFLHKIIWVSNSFILLTYLNDNMYWYRCYWYLMTIKTFPKRWLLINAYHWTVLVKY